MSAFSFLDQLLKAGTDAARGYNARQSDVGKYATGAAAGSLLTMLLGSRGGRRLGGKVLKVGGVAALGVMAWKAYSDWQAQQAAKGASAPAALPEAGFAALPPPQAEAHGQAMLKAMIAAAKSDGHVDERERGLLEAELGRVQAPAELRAWVETELRRPVEPADVAAAATGPEMAAEIYLASVLVVDETSTMERAYLDALARELRLDAGLKATLEARAAAA
ncbi:MAG: tellurite resistance TerB family protein [Rubrivivax sp.]|nr:tellurite resistance TerB family protein [Rubrivivax sp.]